MGSSWASDGKLSRNGRVAVERGMRGGERRLVSSRGVGRRAASVSRRGWRELIAFRGGRGRAGSGRCPKGVVRDTAGRAVDGWRAGSVAFAINGRCREGEFALPRRGQVRVDSDRGRGGVGGCGPNLSAIVSTPSLKSDHRRRVVVVVVVVISSLVC
jgi:hypothetical protein